VRDRLGVAGGGTVVGDDEQPGARMQRRRLDTTTYSSAEADGPRLQLGVAAGFEYYW
jgi:hypothetical protein